jgi:ElaB/YqjD/DUF883 family membrane-anchored ribosome-binding protein
MQKTQEGALVAGANGPELKDRRSADQIREDLRARRRRIASTVAQIESRVQHALDWRGHASRHPFAAAGIAAALGTAAGALLRKPRRPPLGSVAASVAHTVEELRSRIDGALVGAAERVRDRQGRDQARRPFPAALASTVARATLDFFWDKASPPRAAPPANQRATDPDFNRSDVPR